MFDIDLNENEEREMIKLQIVKFEQEKIELEQEIKNLDDIKRKMRLITLIIILLYNFYYVIMIIILKNKNKIIYYISNVILYNIYILLSL